MTKNSPRPACFCARRPRIKPIDDPLPAATEGAPAPCTWDAAGTRLLVQLRLARPLVPPWSAPPAPRKLLAELVPPREEETSPGPPSACAEFRAQVSHAKMGQYQECRGSWMLRKVCVLLGGD